jgi:single-stranded-DNA-specific exonuclease
MKKKTFFEKLLEYYDISQSEYDFLTRSINIQDLPDPFKFKDMDKAVSIVKESMRNNDKIMVYGDYDADGVMSTSIIVKAFMNLDYDIGSYVPSRYMDGYGLNMDRAKQILEKGYKLLITVDNGIRAIEPIEFLKNNGMEVIVIDHHERGDIIPIADVILHPTISNFSSDVATSAGFVSLMFATALLGQYDKYLMTLAAISIVTDMMPLKSFNRDLLRYVFTNYKYGEFANLDMLSESKKLDENIIGMGIGPKINSVGRIIKDTKINRLITFLTSKDKNKIIEYGKWIIEQNQKRKDKSRAAVASVKNIDDNNKVIVTVIDCDEGLIGIVANNLLNEYHKPVIVFTENESNKDILKGSARSIGGFSLVDAFERLNDLTLTAGGHALAAGITIKRNNLEDFSIKINALAEEFPIDKKEQKCLDADLIDINNDNFLLIRTLSPFGEEWKEPFIRIKHLKSESLDFSYNSEHIITKISNTVQIVGFNISRSEVEKSKFVNIYGTLNIHSYKGEENLQFKIKEISFLDNV